MNTKNRKLIIVVTNEIYIFLLTLKIMKHIIQFSIKNYANKW